MHQPIKDSLEEYLKGSKNKIPQEFHAHLGACEECASDLRQIETQSAMLRSFQGSELTEPRAGFYARVMERIEEQRTSSIWSVFLDPRFGRRLAIASAALILLLGTYFVTTDASAPEIAQVPLVEITNPTPPDLTVPQDTIQQDTAEQQQQRDALLVDLASYHE